MPGRPRTTHHCPDGMSRARALTPPAAVVPVCECGVMSWTLWVVVFVVAVVTRIMYDVVLDLLRAASPLWPACLSAAACTSLSHPSRRGRCALSLRHMHGCLTPLTPPSPSPFPLRVQQALQGGLPLDGEGLQGARQQAQRQRDPVPQAGGAVHAPAATDRARCVREAGATGGAGMVGWGSHACACVRAGPAEAQRSCPTSYRRCRCGWLHDVWAFESVRVSASIA